MATTTISNLPALTPASGTVVYAENSSQSGKIDVDNVSNYALTSYDGATLAGSVQTPKAAIDGLNTKIGSTTMGTTATTITGAIAEHESDISTLNSNSTFTCTAGTSLFTIDRQRCFKSGNRVVVSFDATANSAVSNGTDIPFVAIPVAYAPNANLSGLGFVTNSTAFFMAMGKIFLSGSTYYVGQNAFGTIASGTRISVYVEYFM